jgi:hypothetical protein
MARIDCFNDPEAPEPTKIIPAASAVVINHEGKILLQRRSDNDVWASPVGTDAATQEPGNVVVRQSSFGMKPAPCMASGDGAPIKGQSLVVALRPNLK